MHAKLLHISSPGFSEYSLEFDQNIPFVSRPDVNIHGCLHINRTLGGRKNRLMYCSITPVRLLCRFSFIHVKVWHGLSSIINQTCLALGHHAIFTLMDGRQDGVIVLICGFQMCFHPSACARSGRKISLHKSKYD